MNIEYVDIRELRAIYIKDRVTFAFCDIVDGFRYNQAKEVNDFYHGEGYIPNMTIICIGPEPPIESFYQVDERMKQCVAAGFELIVIEPFQYIVNNPHDQEELNAMNKIAEQWALDTGAKIVFVLDTSVKVQENK